MFVRGLLFTVVVFAGASPLDSMSAYGHPPTPGQEPAPGVLLLRNGQVLQGRIARTGDIYRLMLTEGEARIKAADVEFWCRDLEEGYRLKRRTIQHGNVHDHLRLARWCLHNDLLGHAGSELVEAIDADPGHPLIDLLARQLEAARRPRESAPRIGSHETATNPRPSLDDLDRLAQGLSDEAVETFTRTIQPLLVNHCGAAACHGDRSPSEFRLQSFPLDRPAIRRTTLRNLHAVLARVDQENPEASPLLRIPLDAHGTAATPIFPQPQNQQYQRLAGWVAQLSRGPKANAPHVATKKPASGSFLFPWQQAAPQLLPKAATERSRPMRSSAEPVAPSKSSPVTPAAHQEPAETQPVPEPGASVPEHRGKVKRGAPRKTFTPDDPFDPEIFNRRYFEPGESRR